MDLDVKLTNDSGVRIPMNIDHVRDGILAARNLRASNPQLVAALNPGTLIGPFGLQDISETNFAIEPVTTTRLTSLWDSYHDPNKSVADWTPNRCGSFATDGNADSFNQVVAVGSDLSLGEPDKNKFKQLASALNNYRVKGCGELPHFVIRRTDSGKPSPNNEYTNEYAEALQKWQVVKAMEAAGIPQGLVYARGTGELPSMADYMAPRLK
jgi:hypothetical protein